MPQTPSTDSSASDDEPSQLEQLLESWFLKLENNEQPDIDEHCREHPELEADFRRMIGFAADFGGIINQRPATNDSKPSSDEDKKTAPAMLGEFELIAPLGAGGGGEVYLARQTSLRRMVAVKRLRTSEDERSRQRLRREAEVAASLDHPGIVPIYAVGEDAGDAWIAMKWLTGPALDGIDAPLPPREVARIGAAAARALHEAHTAGIVHRDIKPSNVVMDGDNPCIVDFGLARDGQDVVRTTMDGHVSGTLLYMSPEQIRSGGSTITLDGRTDIYSLGATLFELLKGRPPHEAQNPGQVIHEILERDPGQPTGERDLAIIVLRAMDKDRERRFVTALEMAEDLERYLRQEPIFSRPVGVTTRVWKLAKRNRNASFAVGAAAVIALGLGSVLWWNMEQRAAARAEAALRIEEQIDLKLYETAEGLLNALVDEGPDHDSRRIARTLAACLQLEELLDEVQCRTEDVDPTYLRKLMDVDRNALPPDRHPELDLAGPLALALMDCGQEALARLRRVAPSAGRNALIGAIEEPEGDWDLAPPAQQSPLDRLMVALAMRFARRPLSERRSQIDFARKLDEDNDRLSLQDAIQVMNEGDHNTAYKFLQGQTSSLRRRRTLQRLLLREAVYAPRYHKDVGPRVEAMIADYPWQEWTAADAGTVLDALYWLEDAPSKRTSELLTRALDRWPNDWYLRIQTARSLLDTDPQQAERLLTGSQSLAKTNQQRDESLVTLLSQRAWQTPLMLVPWQRQPTAEETSALEKTQADARDALEQASTKPAARDITIILARATLTLGDIKTAANLLDQLDEGCVEVVLEKSQQAVAFLWATSGTSAWLRQCRSEARRVLGGDYSEQLQVARVALLNIEPEVSSSLRFFGRRADFHYWLLRSQIAFGRQDISGGQVAVKRLQAIFEHSPAAGYDGLVNYLVERLAR